MAKINILNNDSVSYTSFIRHWRRIKELNQLLKIDSTNSFKVDSKIKTKVAAIDQKSKEFK